MPSFYGSKARPKEIFGEGPLLEAFFHVMKTELPGIWYLNEALQGLWKPDALEHGWILPDNFHVHVKVIDDQVETVNFLNRPYEVVSKVNSPTKEGRSISANVVHSIDGMVVREMMRRCNFDAERVKELHQMLYTGKAMTSEVKDNQLVQILWDHYIKTGFLSARILDVLHHDNVHRVNQKVIKDLLETLPKKPFQLLAVHDCFRVHPNYGNDLRTQYNQVLFDLAKSTILASIASQINGEPTVVSKYGSIASKVLQANYALS